MSVDFDKKKAQPHENVNLIVSADPDSIVNLLAVDQSVLLMKSGNDIREREVMTFFKFKCYVKYIQIITRVFDPSPDLSPSRPYQPEPEGQGRIWSEG